MKRFLILGVLLLLPMPSESQTTCFRYQGGIASCDSPQGYTTQMPFTRSQGLLQTDRAIEPYTIMPAPDPSRRESFSSRHIEPLEPLPSLDSRSRRDRLDDPFSDPLTRSLLLGE
jgi:hypothetical protein